VSCPAINSCSRFQGKLDRQVGIPFGLGNVQIAFGFKAQAQFDFSLFDVHALIELFPDLRDGPTGFKDNRFDPVDGRIFYLLCCTTGYRLGSVFWYFDFYQGAVTQFDQFACHVSSLPPTRPKFLCVASVHLYAANIFGNAYPFTRKQPYCASGYLRPS
jgi:hypothetical protein